MSLLQVEDLHAGYGPVEVLHGLDFHVEENEVVVVLGANGAGKTTTLRALSGMIPARGSITFAGESLVGRKASDIVARHIAHVPQGRGTFSDISVDENLDLGAFSRRDRAQIAADKERWYGVFPRLAERRSQLAGSLSGGEQQMLAVARALMSRPRLLLLDEPSLGLAPIVTQGLFSQFAEVNRDLGTAMLVVEQNAHLALGIAHRAYVLETGTIAASGPAAEMRSDESIRRAYLGY